MSHFFKISAKTLTLMMVYIFLVYSVTYSFSFVAGQTGYVGVLPSITVTKTNITQEEINATINEGYGLLTGIVGAIIGVLAGVAIVMTWGAATPFVAIALGGAVTGIGVIGGYEIGYGISAYAHSQGISLAFDDFVVGLRTFFGSILDFFFFAIGFLTFGVFGTTASMGLPNEFYWIVFFMTFPVWIYFLVLVAGFGIEAWRSVKSW